MENLVELKVEKQAYGGDAIGKLPDGRVVFIPYAIPGEVVRVNLLEHKPHYARAQLIEVIETSDERILPRCQHFGLCGGCHYQHINYPAQLKTKAGILQQQMERIGNLKQTPPIIAVASPETWYYRNHVQFHLTKQGKLGFQEAHSNQTFAIQECHLPEKVINQIWPQIDIEPLSGVERVNLRSGMEKQVMLILEGNEPQPPDLNIESLMLSVVQTGPAGNVILAGSDHISMEISNRRFSVSPTSFFQINRAQAIAMVKLVLEVGELTQSMTVLDVFSGVGLFSAFIAPRVRRLVGIELSPKACEDYSRNLNEFDNVELYEAAADKVLGSIQFNPDLILMDPPRAGLGRETVQAVIAQQAAHLVYVSCDPATLARDGKQLTMGGYSLRKLILIDMFPQTFHIESISLWERG